MKNILFPIILSVLFTANAYPENQQILSDRIYDGRVKTVQLYREEWNLSQPLISLGAGQKLRLEFDILGSDYDNLAYSFIHCSKDWEPSGLFPSDYVDGFHENRIEMFRPSFNTTVNYIHYSLVFPNDDVQLLLSGNYIILIHPPGDAEKVLLTRRFMVSENMAAVGASSRRAEMGLYSQTHQQVDVSVNISGIRGGDPQSEIFTTVLQNGRWDKAQMNLLPDFVTHAELKYSSLDADRLFEGGNEFRQFDIRSFRYQSEFVTTVTYDGMYHNVKLQSSENREFRPYFFRNDFNGKYIVEVQEGIDPNVESDYAWVHFTLPALQKAEGGRLFVAGDFSLWRYSPDYEMRYNYEDRQYEGAVLVKQGWYNYEYVFVPDSEGTERRKWFEGSHFETENEYLILVYYRARNSRFDRLIGSQIIKNPAG